MATTLRVAECRALTLLPASVITGEDSAGSLNLSREVRRTRWSVSSPAVRGHGAAGRPGPATGPVHAGTRLRRAGRAEPRRQLEPDRRLRALISWRARMSGGSRRPA